jgi:D-proline reductase (dithiol) PrdB
MYEGRGPFPGEEEPVWAPFERRLAESRIALLTSAGMFARRSQPSFDLEREQSHPEWGDPTWRAISAAAAAADIEVAHLHINDEDLLADPEIALPMHLLDELATEGVVGSATEDHLSVMGFQERSLRDWKLTTAPELIARLQGQGAGGLILAPA